ncbi:alpha/beta-hydrolase [Pleomassaria siparia CBS 279.74]|uniref:Alpha/beta-hydrolase n=1 Tax=Pleomassaria siparia CBS 279.74 TaxID=1314801 RepID=A0A6G1KR46_9PLEO|nr:alpha/beta-hydrolase [Pleomassaria siparia CBS 279.74]
MQALPKCARSLYAPFTHPKHTNRIRFSPVSQPQPWTRSFHASASYRALPLAFDLYDNSGEATGAPILILHGLFGSKRNNRSISKALARDLSRPIYALDLRNHGDSPHEKEHNYVALAQDTEAFLKEHNLKDATLIGHSMGAKTVMTMALRDPSCCANIIAVDNAPVDAALLSDFPRYVEGMRRVESANPQSQKEANKILEPFAPDLAVRQYLLTNFARPGPGEPYKWRIPIHTLANSLGNLGDFPFRNPEEARFNKPALFVRGTKSHYVADETIPIIGRFFPRFQMVDVDSGHWVISENPEAFRQAVVEFLQDSE